MSSVIKAKQNLVYSLKSQNEILIGLYIGIWSGDGTQYYDKGYRIKICCHSNHKKMIAFFQYVLSELFGKTVTQVTTEAKHRAVLRYKSKFIYEFVSHYLTYTKKKTYTVTLKCNPLCYSSQFLEGFILGLALTDGYLKERFYFNTTSEGLAHNVLDILRIFGFIPKYYIHNR